MPNLIQICIIWGLGLYYLIHVSYYLTPRRVLERLIVNCSSGSLSKVGVLLVPHTIDIACHTFASHVLELFLMRTVTLVYKEGMSLTVSKSIPLFF